MGTPPTLSDFRDELLRQTEPEAHSLALELELFTRGSLNTFSKQTNVNTANRLVCYDILELGEQLRAIGMLVILDSIINRITKRCHLLPSAPLDLPLRKDAERRPFICDL